MGVDDWDIIGQCTSSSLLEDAPIKQTCLGTGNVHREFPVSSAHDCVQYVRQNIREDMEDRWVTNLREDRKRFYLVSSLLDPLTKISMDLKSFESNRYPTTQTL